jgi:YegS/Rv2252/BmrU family lipid kinase
MSKRKICFIHNPISGTRRIGKLEDLIRDHLDLDKFDYAIRETARPKDAMKLASEAVRDGFEIVVAVGGDGTINEVLQGMGSNPVILGILPVGSGNGLARHLGIPLEPEKAIRTLNHMNLKNIDIATINGYPFISIAGLGFDARVANQYNKLKKRGLIGYTRIIAREYFRYREREFVLSFNDMQIKRKALLLSVANSNQFGYNTIIAPQAQSDDGLLEIVITRKFPFRELPRMVGLLFTGKIDQSPYIETYKTREIFVLRKRGKRVNIDGEAVRMGREIFIRIQPSFLQVII